MKKLLSVISVSALLLCTACRTKNPPGNPPENPDMKYDDKSSVEAPKPLVDSPAKVDSLKRELDKKRKEKRKSE